MCELIVLRNFLKDNQTFVISGNIRLQNIVITPTNFSLMISLYQALMKIMKLALNLLPLQR